MTLLETIGSITYFNYVISFRHEPRHIVVVLSKGRNKRESWLPLEDHCTEAKIIQHLNLMLADMPK